MPGTAVFHPSSWETTALSHWENAPLYAMKPCGGSLPAKGQHTGNLHNQISSFQPDFASNLYHSGVTPGWKTIFSICFSKALHWACPDTSGWDAQSTSGSHLSLDMAIQIFLSPWKPWCLLPMPAVTNYHRFSGSKQNKYFRGQFCRAEVCHGSQWVKIKAWAGPCSFMEAVPFLQDHDSNSGLLLFITSDQD